MKLLRLIENELPSALEMLQLLLRKKEPVMLVSYSSTDGIRYNEIFKAERQETFAAGAGAKLAGKPYTVVEARGEGFYSWETNDLGIGQGSPTTPVPNDSDEWDIDKLKVFRTRPPIFVFGRKKYLDIVRHRKVTEATALDDGRVMLKGGFYMEPDLPRPAAGHKSWTIKRLMDDDTVVATADTINTGATHSGDYTFYLETPANKNQVKLRFRAPSYKMMLDHFYDWVEKGLKHMIKEDLFADSAKARKAKSNMDKPVYMRRLNKDGGESGLRDATSFHNTEEEAKAHHDQLVKNNPRSKIAHHMYSYNGDETFKTKFVGGKLVPLKGGINGSDEDRLEDATHDFIQLLDDEGSAAGMWMPYPKKVELYKLYRAKHKVKSVGVDTEGITDPAKAAAKVDKKVSALGARGWKLFAKEENGDYVDMVFTKAP